MKKLINILIVAFVAMNLLADEKPKAMMKAEYVEIVCSHVKSDGDTVKTEYDFILQIAPGYSCYYNPRTYHVDSLKNDPNGKLIYDRIHEDALNDYMESGKDWFQSLREKGMMRESSKINFKDFSTGVIDVWDSTGGDRHHYPVAMTDLEWEIGDSTKCILGYECTLAVADYHGRRWQAWFAADIPVQDGPWQLCGLPGLIMKAVSDDGLFSFEIKGLQQCDETLKTVFEQEKYFDSTRKAFLKVKNYGRQNRGAQVSAMTGGKINLIKSETKYLDLIETDYHQ